MNLVFILFLFLFNEIEIYQLLVKIIKISKFKIIIVSLIVIIILLIIFIIMVIITFIIIRNNLIQHLK